MSATFYEPIPNLVVKQTRNPGMNRYALMQAQTQVGSSSRIWNGPKPIPAQAIPSLAGFSRGYQRGLGLFGPQDASDDPDSGDDGTPTPLDGGTGAGGQTGGPNILLIALGLFALAEVMGK